MLQKVRSGSEKARETLIEVEANKQVDDRMYIWDPKELRPSTDSTIPKNDRISITYPMISLHFFHFFSQFGKRWSITWIFLPA